MFFANFKQDTNFMFPSGFTLLPWICREGAISSLFWCTAALEARGELWEGADKHGGRAGGLEYMV